MKHLNPIKEYVIEMYKTSNKGILNDSERFLVEKYIPIKNVIKVSENALKRQNQTIGMVE